MLRGRPTKAGLEHGGRCSARTKRICRDYDRHPWLDDLSDKLFEAFRNFTVADKASGLSAENINGQIDFAKTRLREEIATANYSNEAGIQVLLEVDPQVLKAVEIMPEARKMLDRNVASN